MICPTTGFFTFAGTGIGFCPLSPDRQAFAVADAPVGAYLHYDGAHSH